MTSQWCLAHSSVVVLVVSMALMSAACAAEGRLNFPCPVSIKQPVPPDWLENAGIDYAYASVRLRPGFADPQAPRNQATMRTQVEKLCDLYADSGVKVLLMGNYYISPPSGMESVDVSGRKIRMACLNKDEFHRWMGDLIREVGEHFKKKPAFGGFAFDDGIGVRVDCCYCDTCRRLFRKRHGIDPPPFEPRDGVDVVDLDAPLLLWDRFQREATERYYRTQAEAARAVSPDLLCVSIPSDSYFYGRFMNSTAPQAETPPKHSSRLVRIERFQLRHWHLMQSFSFPRLTAQGLEPWAAGCHVTCPSPQIIQHAGEIEMSRRQRKFDSPAELKRLIHVTLTEGAPGISYWAPSNALPLYESGYEAIAESHRDMARIEPLLANKKRLPARVGIMYSTTTEVYDQAWRRNTLERWKHLHAVESLAYSLLRSNVPFQIVCEDELSPDKLSELDVLVMANTRFLTTEAAQSLRAAREKSGLGVFRAGRCAPCEGARACDYDSDVWHRHLLADEQTVASLDEQWAEAQRALIPALKRAVRRPPWITVESTQAIHGAFRNEDGSYLLLLANWDLAKPARARIAALGMKSTTDLLTGQPVTDAELTISPAGWRALRLE